MMALLTPGRDGRVRNLLVVYLLLAFERLYPENEELPLSH
jgi:hypothetical protein